MRALVTDFDGTICFDGRTVRPDIVQALERIQEHGRLIIATARPIRDIVPVLPPSLRDVDLIGGNGAFTRISGVVSAVSFPEYVRERLEVLVAGHAPGALVDSAWDYHYSGDGTDSVIAKVDRAGSARNLPIAQLTELAKVLFFEPTNDLIASVDQLPAVSYLHDSERVLDVAPGASSKFLALEKFGLGAGGYIGAGNDANDVQLLECAAHSIRVGDYQGLSFAHRSVDAENVAAALDEAGEMIQIHLKAVGAGL